MSRSSQRQQPGSMFITALIAGLFTGSAIVLCLSAIGLPRLEAAVFATLSAGTIAAFVYRERSLTATLEAQKIGQQIESNKWNSRIDVLYDDMLVCLAYFDAGTLSVDRVSPGFLEGLRIAPDLKTRGQSIADLLRVAPSKMEAIVSQAQRQRNPAFQHELVIEDALGNQLPLIMTADYHPDVHMIEAAFFVSPTHGSKELEGMENTRKDLERFRRGMYRRETRILELKEEVNEVLKAAGKPSRYRTDLLNEETDLPSPLEEGKKESEEPS